MDLTQSSYISTKWRLFPMSTKVLTAWIHMNIETKRSCQLIAFLWFLVSFQFEEAFKKSKLKQKSRLHCININAYHCTIVDLRYVVILLHSWIDKNMFFQNPLNNKKVDGETFLNKIRTRNSTYLSSSYSGRQRFACDILHKKPWINSKKNNKIFLKLYSFTFNFDDKVYKYPFTLCCFEGINLKNFKYSRSSLTLAKRLNQIGWHFLRQPMGDLG